MNDLNKDSNKDLNMGTALKTGIDLKDTTEAPTELDGAVRDNCTRTAPKHRCADHDGCTQ